MNFLLFSFIYVIIILILFQIPAASSYLKKNISKIFNLTSTILLTCLGIYYQSSDPIYNGYLWKEYYNYVLGIAIVFLFIGFFFDMKEASKIKKQKKELEDVRIELSKKIEETNNQNEKINILKNEYFKLCSDFIRNCFKESFFKSSSSDLRISLYKNSDNGFILLGRYSKNPKFNRKGREIYPDDEGFISVGWEKEFFEIFDLPDFNSNKGRSYIKFIKEKCNIASETITNMKMKSRSYLIIRVNNDDSREPLGIFVFETLAPSKIFNSNIKTSFDENEKSFVHLLKAMKNLQN